MLFSSLTFVSQRYLIICVLSSLSCDPRIHIYNASHYKVIGVLTVIIETSFHESF